jgi:hypothetical protein
MSLFWIQTFWMFPIRNIIVVRSIIPTFTDNENINSEIINN